MVPDRPRGVSVLDARHRLARRRLDALLVEVRVALAAAEHGDLAAIYDLHCAANRAAMLMLEHRLDAA